MPCLAHQPHGLTRPIETVEIPATVQVVLAARIDRLAERDKELLQAASVVGKSFAEPILRRVVNRSDLELLASLGALRQAEFVYEESVHPETVYAFKHPLTHEVAYKTQLTEQRMRTHAAVARAVEEAYPEKLDERAADIARHWEHVGDARKAGKWHRRAAEWLGLNNPAEALRHWGSVRQLLDTLPETPENLTERAAVCARIMNHLARLGDLEDQATSLFRDGRELATRSGDPHVLSQVLNGFGRLRLYAGAVTEALDQFLESIRRADETDVEFVLSHSGWRWVAVAFGETFEMLVECVQGALWELGAVPEVLRSDNLSVATHELKEGGRSLTRRFREVLEHYGMRSSASSQTSIRTACCKRTLQPATSDC